MTETPMEKAQNSPSVKMNYVFVDCENVLPDQLSIFGSKCVRLKLLLGARQTKLDTNLVSKLLENSTTIELIRLESSGRNALDFAVAYYLGKAVEADPFAFFHIISKDTGFDPLVAHLRCRNIYVRRHDDFEMLPFSPKPAVKAPGPLFSPLALPTLPIEATPLPKMQDPLAVVLAHLRKNVNNRPKKKKTLLSHIKSHLGKGATEAQALTLVEKLRKAGQLKIGEKDLVTYSL